MVAPWVCPWLLVGAGLLLSADGAADVGERVLLRWTRGPDAEACIDGPALGAAVEVRLGRPVFATPDDASARADRVVSGGVQRTKGGFAVDMEVRDNDGQRLGRRSIESHGEDCAALSDAVTLLVALLVDPTAASAAPAVAAAPPVIPAPPPPPAPTPPVRQAPRLRAGLGAVAWAGPLPGVAFGPRLSLGVQLAPAFSLEAVIDGVPQAAIQDASGGSLTMRSLGGAAGACLHRARGALALGACGIFHAAALVADGRDFSGDNASATRPELWPGLELRARRSGRRLWAQLALGAGAPLVRDSFYVALPTGERRLLHRAAPVLGWLAIDVGL